MALYPNSTLPVALPIRDALSQSAPLARLQQMLRESTYRYELVRPLLPSALMAHLRPGPVDEEAWALLAANASVAAKLRQWVPKLETALRQSGCQPSAIRVRIQSR